MIRESITGRLVSRTESPSDGRLASFDRLCYAAFARHVERPRHDGDRRAYRATDLETSFGVFLTRLYAVSWIAALLTFAVTWALVGTVFVRPLATTAARVPVVGHGGVALALGGTVGTAVKYATVRVGCRYLRWRGAARRIDIERTLPGATRYLHVLSTGSDDLEGMLRRVADNRSAYGHTAVAFRTALNRSEVTGSIGEGLRSVARDTPSRDVLAPFLLNVREHAAQGNRELASYLRMEARILSQRQSRTRERQSGYLELLAELFVVMLVLPALLVIVVSVLSVLSTGLDRPVATPVGLVPLRAVVVYGSAAVVLVVGAVAAVTIGSLRPPGYGHLHARPNGIGLILSTAGTNPASTVAVALPLGIAVGGALWYSGLHAVDVVLLGYAAWAIPVGIVAARRARLDDAKDREIKDFVHAVSGHISLGRPFPDAVERVARDVDLGPLDSDVADLAFNARLATRGGALRTEALDRFVSRVGTPLAEQTVGLVAGALEAGSDTEDVFSSLQAEVGRLYHEKRSLRSSMQVYVAVGWTTALLIVAITIAVNSYVLDGFTQLATVADADSTIAFDVGGVDAEAMQFRFYVVTQATMLACGWFAGMASQGRYAALLHSGALVTVAYVAFSVVGTV